jgi:hypothetical protein
MEPERFDRLTRRFTIARSRRRMLGMLGSTALAIGVSMARPRPASAKCRKATNCTKNRTRFCHDTDECHRVKNVDTGKCVGIALGLCGELCTTGSECASGLRTHAKGCCSDRKVCASPCPQ